MKKILLTSLVVFTFFASCKKGNEPASEQEPTKYNVTFSISDFSQSEDALGKTRNSVSEDGDTLSNHANFLYCYIFPSNMTSVSEVIEVKQTLDSPDFGKPSVKLAPGEYSVTFVASKQPSLVLYGRRPDLTDITRPSESSQTYWDDLFYLYNYKLVVTTENKVVPVRLDRLVGAIELNVEDAIPVSAEKIVIETDNDAFIYRPSINAYTEHRTSTKTFELSDSDKGQKDRRFLMHVLNTEDFPRLNVKIRAYDAENALIAEKSVNDVRARRNTKTVLSGSLFSTSLTLAVSVNPTWGTPGTPVSF